LWWMHIHTHADIVYMIFTHSLFVSMYSLPLTYFLSICFCFRSLKCVTRTFSSLSNTSLDVPLIAIVLMPSSSSTTKHSRCIMRYRTVCVKRANEYVWHMQQHRLSLCSQQCECTFGVCVFAKSLYFVLQASLFHSFSNNDDYYYFFALLTDRSVRQAS